MIVINLKQFGVLNLHLRYAESIFTIILLIDWIKFSSQLHGFRSIKKFPTKHRNVEQMYINNGNFDIVFFLHQLSIWIYKYSNVIKYSMHEFYCIVCSWWNLIFVPLNVL